jgi:hypothetical protein
VDSVLTSLEYGKSWNPPSGQGNQYHAPSIASFHRSERNGSPDNLICVFHETDGSGARTIKIVKTVSNGGAWENNPSDQTEEAGDPSIVAFPPPGDELEIYTNDSGSAAPFYIIGTTTDLFQKTAAHGARPVTPNGIQLVNHPNPFSKDAYVEYAVPTDMWLRLSVYDGNGRELLVLREGDVPAGRHEALLPSASLPVGVLYLRLRTATGLAIRPITHLR